MRGPDVRRPHFCRAEIEHSASSKRCWKMLAPEWAFSRGIGRPSLEAGLQKVRDQFPTPEDINDSPITAPSKRVMDLVPGYEKPLLGTLAALQIGLGRIRQECPHFDAWVARLESAAHL